MMQSVLSVLRTVRGVVGASLLAIWSVTFSGALAPGMQPDSTAGLVVFLGDSLTAGYGLAEDQAFPALIERRLAASSHAVTVVNAGVSGDTSAGGLRRLGWLLRQEPDVVVVGLGGNDGLRGLPVERTEENLREIVRRVRAAGAQVLLLGMMVPTNYGPEYGEQFAQLFPRIAEQEQVALVPFLLEGVGGVAELNLADGIHPTAAGQEIVADNVIEHLLPLVGGLSGRP
jgi:acyl-CoA thioesterase-1